MIILEAIGAIFSIVGAYLMSLSSKDNTRPLYFGFISFFISNLALLTFFTLNGKIPVIIQMILFFITAIIGIYKLTKNRKRDVSLISLILSIYISILIFTIIPNIEDIDFNVLIIDFIAASIAIVGSYLLSSPNHIMRSYAFICFFVADVIFVYIGYVNAYYFFMIQSAFYLFTSTKGYHNTMKNEIDIFLKRYRKD
ncbi:nicotinamide mononucleotide transporter [Arcobacter peruensis]|uniref:nicotinamide mononucleotide transporter n=1 Tax=Arcobacter peruensis TaxID=2320140 RepID=UPI000F08B146|nr:nicotinamide mononucleotide transporter [Arcobacter peruensis]